MTAIRKADSDIDALYVEWRDAFAQEDINAILKLLTPDYVLWAPGMPPTTRESLAPRLTAAFSNHYLVPSFEREEQLVSGDLAFERGWDVQEIRPRAGGDARIHRQRVFLLLKRGRDGKWRFARGMSQAGPPP